MLSTFCIYTRYMLYVIHFLYLYLILAVCYPVFIIVLCVELGGHVD